MLSSKTFATVMLCMATAGMVVTGLLLITSIAVSIPPVEVESAPVVTMPFPDLSSSTPDESVPDDVGDDETDSPRSTTDDEEEVGSAGVVSLPVAGFSAPLSETSTVDGVVTPPDFKHAFRVTDVAAEVYVTHSCRFEQCLGNALFNLRSGEVFAQRGQTLWVDGKRYTVTEVRTLAKDELPFDSVWKTDGVAVITCFQNKDLTPSTKNLVVVAQPADI